MLIFSKSPPSNRLYRSRITFNILDIFYLYLFFLLSSLTRDCRVICQGFSVTKRYNCFRPFGHVTQPAHLHLLHHSIIVDDKLHEIDCDLYTSGKKIYVNVWSKKRVFHIETWALCRNCYAKASWWNLVQLWENRWKIMCFINYCIMLYECILWLLFYLNHITMYLNAYLNEYRSYIKFE